MVTRPKAVIESHDGEEFSLITIAKNVLTDDGQNLQDILSDRKEDMMTPTIENSSSMFKVGQGDNVDYSENVVDGAYESCILKGITKFIDNDTGEISSSFIENRNLSLIDCKSPILTNIGKNLVIHNPVAKSEIYNEVSFKSDGNIVTGEGTTSKDFVGYDIDTGYIGYMASLGACHEFYKDKRLGGPGTYTASAIFNTYISNQTPSNGIAVTVDIYYDDNQIVYLPPNCLQDGEKIVSKTFTVKKYIQGVFIEVWWANVDCSKISIKEIQLEKNSLNTFYEPYKSNTTTFSTDDDKTIVLRSLPNGVYDTLNVETGEYVQRIGEFILDDEFITDMEMPNINSDNDTLLFILKNSINVQGQFINSSLPKDTYDNHLLDREMLIINNDKILIRLKKDKLENIDIISFINYLDLNPITVQYELEAPIVKQVNVEDYPFAYKDGHVILSSGSIEQSLLPTIEYSVATNRNGQIRSNQKIVERHQKELDQLQAMVLANLVNAQYEQTLTNLKYNLKNVREEVK